MTRRSIVSFERMELPDGFLMVDSEMWEERDDFHQASTVVHAIKMVNHMAERGVALIQEFSGTLTKSEPQLQFLLKEVEKHCRAYPNSRKQTLAGQHKQ